MVNCWKMINQNTGWFGNQPIKNWCLDFQGIYTYTYIYIYTYYVYIHISIFFVPPFFLMGIGWLQTSNPDFFTQRTPSWREFAPPAKRAKKHWEKHFQFHEPSGWPLEEPNGFFYVDGIPWGWRRVIFFFPGVQDMAGIFFPEKK